jgi:hypothetical protein
VRGDLLAVAWHAHLLQDIAEPVIRQTVHDEPHRTVLAVLADEGDAAREIGIAHARHGDQEMAGQRRRFGGTRVRCLRQVAVRRSGA